MLSTGARRRGGPTAGEPAIRPGADHNVMREVNRSLVLDVLKSDGPVSRADIAKLTSLGKPTELTLLHARERVEVRPSRLGPDAEIRGAVLLALRRSQQSYRVVFQV